MCFPHSRQDGHRLSLSSPRHQYVLSTMCLLLDASHRHGGLHRQNSDSRGCQRASHSDELESIIVHLKESWSVLIETIFVSKYGRSGTAHMMARDIRCVVAYRRYVHVRAQDLYSSSLVLLLDCFWRNKRWDCMLQGIYIKSYLLRGAQKR